MWPFRKRELELPKNFVDSDRVGFQLTRDGIEMPLIKWSKILRVSAFRHDQFSFDEIAIEIRYHDEQEPDGLIEVRESDLGYHRLLVRMEYELDRFPPASEWWRTVAIPAFELNLTELWTRSRGDAVD